MTHTIQQNRIECPNLLNRSLDESQIINWLRLIRDRRWSLRQKHVLLEQFACPANIYACSTQELAELKLGKINNVTDNGLAIKLDQDIQWLEESEHSLITIYDENYPDLLKEIYDPPIALFAKGKLACLKDPKVAMVGSRRPTPVGSKLTENLASGLAQLGVVITSGMALGVDGGAHQAALRVNSPTIAIMGCGLDTIYPMRHKGLFEQIAATGCLLSEYPLGYPPARHHFPQRNRIVSGMSLGVVIIEAAERSGTIITARLAMEQNRQVMVVPGSALNTQYNGSHRLIRQGASIVTDVEDIINDLAKPLQELLEKIKLNESLKKDKQLNISEKITTANPLMRHINYDSTNVNDIILASRLTAAEVSSMLLILEVEGLIAIAEDGGYMRLC